MVPAVEEIVTSIPKENIAEKVAPVVKEEKLLSGKTLKETSEERKVT